MHESDGALFNSLFPAGRVILLGELRRGSSTLARRTGWSAREMGESTMCLGREVIDAHVCDWTRETCRTARCTRSEALGEAWCANVFSDTLETCIESKDSDAANVWSSLIQGVRYGAEKE